MVWRVLVDGMMHGVHKGTGRSTPEQKQHQFLLLFAAFLRARSENCNAMPKYECVCSLGRVHYIACLLLYYFAGRTVTQIHQEKGVCVCGKLDQE